MPERTPLEKNPFLYPGTHLPFLLDTEEFVRLSKIQKGGSTLNRVRNRVDVLLIGPQEDYPQPAHRPRKLTVRQPLPFALGLAAELKSRRGEQIARVAMDYCLTDDAKDRIREGRAYFKDLLDNHTQDGCIYSGAATGILNLRPEAVYHWYRTGVVYSDEVAKGIGGDERELYVARSAVERLCKFRLPDPLRDSGIPDLPYTNEA